MPNKKTDLLRISFLSVVVFSLFLGLKPVFALSNDDNQAFCPSTIANWTHSCGGCAGTNFVLTNGAFITDDPITQVYTCPTTQGELLSNNSCTSCSVTLTYSDPSTATGGTQQYILVDLYTANIGRQFQLIVTDTTGASVTSGSPDLLYDCSGGGIEAGSTLANTWTTLFVYTGGIGTVATVDIIANQAATMNTDPVYFDMLRGASNLPCLVPPTNTPTPTTTDTDTSTATGTPTDTFTITPTNTPTLSPTNTDSSTPTLSATSTFTNTDTPSPTSSSTPTPPNTPTQTGTPTPTFTPVNTLTSTATFTPPPSATFTFSPTITFTLTATGTPTHTATFTSTSSPTLSPTFTDTFTPSLTPTITPTPTDTNTPGPSPTYTPTFCPVVVYPDPMDFQHNPPYTNCVDCGFSPSVSSLKFGCIPATATLRIYTISLKGSLVREFKPGDPSFHPSTINPGVGTIAWDGTNGALNPVAPGFYFYVVDGGPHGRSIGQFAITRSAVGP